MRKIFFTLSFGLLFLSCSNVYYVDALLGNDTNSGTSPNEAWASLNKVNASIFQPEYLNVSVKSVEARSYNKSFFYYSEKSW